MKPYAYAAQASVADRHWWYEGRRSILQGELDRLGLSEDSKIFEIGCGNGSNIPLLARYGSVWAMDPEVGAVRAAASRCAVAVQQGSLPNDLPFADQRFDLVAMLDVLEHLGDDIGALRVVKERLVIGGRLVLMVPAYQWLWSSMDEISEHKRRYTVPGLLAVCKAAGLSVERSTYFNTLLFPMVAAMRLAERVIGTSSAEFGLSLPPPWQNIPLTSLFGLESRLLAHGTLPFGVSALVICRRPD